MSEFTLGWSAGLDRLVTLLRGEASVPELSPELAETLRRGRLGLLTHPAAVDRDLVPAVTALRRAGAHLAALFGPEHGVQGAAAAGEKVAGGTDPETGLPAYSLYGETRKPTPEMLRDLDVVVVDLQDVGTRFYTYIATLSLVMEAAAEADLPVVVLDRANPVGGRVMEGPLLDPACASFIGPHPIPLRHACTIGELALLFHREFGVGREPAVIPLEAWDRGRWPVERPWAPPSPNIPSADAALLYPGVGLLEGSNLSEGRGTTKPFEWIGAPWIDAGRWCDAMTALELPGVRFRPVSFVPTVSKHTDQFCHGLHLHLVERDAVRAVTLGTALLSTARHLWPHAFDWLEQRGISKIDRLAGTDRLRREIDAGTPPREIEAGWQADLHRFEPIRRRVLLYG